MEPYFEIVARNLIEIGFYEYILPTLMTAAIIYGLLKKSKLVGESIVVNGTLAISIALLIFGFPALAGISLATPLSTFFTYTIIFILVFVVGILLASLFYPNLQDFLTKYFVERVSRTFWGLIVLGLALLIMSNLLWVLIGPTTQPKPGAIVMPLDLIISIVGIIIFTIIIFLATWMMRGV